MKSFKEFIKEAAGDRVEEPVSPLLDYDSEEKSFVVDDYPYGRLRTQIRYWLEFDKSKGFRFVSQTQNPKNSKWNKPKKSTYCKISAFMYKDHKGFVGWKGITEYNDTSECEEFLRKYKKFLSIPALKRLEIWIKRKQDFDKKIKSGEARFEITTSTSVSRIT